MAQHFIEDGVFTTKNSISVQKYRSKKSNISVYFCDIESQTINGYFSYGIDQPEASGIETLLWQLDSSGGLLPLPMRGDMLRAAWQFHGAENPLADRDQSCYVCSALGEVAFLGTFSCCMYLLQNIEAVFEAHGFHAGGKRQVLDEENLDEGGEPSGGGSGEGGDKVEDQSEMVMEAGGDSEPKLNCREFYCLSEAGEGAMAWEATLQTMFPGCKPFWNRLLFEGKNRMSHKMRASYDYFYRPQNLSVVITGTIEDKEHILDTLHEYEVEFAELHPNLPEFVRPWAPEALPPFQYGVETSVKFIPRNPRRKPNATICFGWRGCPSSDIETAFALKVFTAYASVGPFWSKYITSGIAQRISWCVLEYSGTAALVTIHGIKTTEDSDMVVTSLKELIGVLADENNDTMKLQDIHAMIERVCWHNVRELESEPALVLASCITKAELYGFGEKEQLEKRLEPSGIFEELLKQPLSYWKGLVTKYFISHGTFVTKLIPRSFDPLAEEPEVPAPEETFQSELPSERSFCDTSRRASSRPRMTNSNPVGSEGCNIQEDLAKPETPSPKAKGSEEKGLETSTEATSVKDDEEKEDDDGIGHLERLLHFNPKPFPFVDYAEEAQDFEVRLTTTAKFLNQIAESKLRNYPVKTYSSDGEAQHPKFPVDQMPFYTFLDDTQCSFVYMTCVMDTSHLNDEERKFVGVLTSALGAVLCPRPPGLDSDIDILNPTEFNPPLLISDSQVSLGLNGEMMQNIFATLISRPEHYKWTIGMMNYCLYQNEFDTKFLRFVCSEAAKGLAYNYRMQTVDQANYEYFDACEINMYSLIKQVYKKDSNARLFVGRRRLDLLVEYLTSLDANPDAVTKATNATWRKIIDNGRIVFQIAANVDQITSQVDPIAPWKEYFGSVQKSLKFNENRPTLELHMLNMPKNDGIAVAVKHARPACLTLAIPIDATAADFPALAVAMQLYTMAQKWVWGCIEEEDPGQAAFRMPCSFANIITLNMESSDIIGSLQIMKLIVDENWEWLNSLLIATKLVIVNDPSTHETGPQGAIAMNLLSNLAHHSVTVRRDLIIKCLKVSLDEVKYAIRTHLARFFKPSEAWCALMAEEDERPKLISRLQSEFGYNLQEVNLIDLCTSL